MNATWYMDEPDEILRKVFQEKLNNNWTTKDGSVIPSIVSLTMNGDEVIDLKVVPENYTKRVKEIISS